MPPGRLLEPVSNDGPRGMVVALRQAARPSRREQNSAYGSLRWPFVDRAPTVARYDDQPPASNLQPPPLAFDAGGQPSLTHPPEARYRLKVIPRRLLAGTLLLVLAIAIPGVAAAHSRHERRIHSVTLKPDGAGTLISIRFVDRMRPRLLRLTERVDAFVVRDVDNDGDLDILAASTTRGLLLWRNAGRGHFVLAAGPSERPARPPQRTIRHRASEKDGPAASDDRYDATAPRGPGPTQAEPAIPFAPRLVVFHCTPAFHSWYGRSPPSVAL